MNKCLTLILLFCMANLLYVRPASALLKTDISNAAAEVTVVVSELGKKVQKAIEESSVVATVKKLGEGYSKYKGNFDKLVARAEAEKKGIMQAKALVEGEIDSAKDGLNSLKEEKAKLEAKTQGLKELNNLKEEKASIQAVFASDQASLQAAAKAKISNIDNNSAIYQELISSDPAKREQYEQILASNAQQKIEIQNQLAADIQQATLVKDQQISAIEAKIKTMSLELLELGIDKGKELAGKLFTINNQAAAANQETANRLFLGKDEPATLQNNNRIKAARNKEALSNTLDAFDISLRTKIKPPASNDLAEGISDTVTMLDGSNEAISQDTMAKVEQMKIIIDLMRLRIASLKATTMAEMSQANDYPMQEYDTDLGVIDLCSYKPTEEQSKKAISKIKTMFGVK